MEEWRAIEGYGGRYYVSNLGRVKSIGGKRCKHKPVIMSQLKQNSGYMFVKLFRNGKHDTRTVHRLVAEAFLGKSEHSDINHIDGDKTNNNVSNLEYCSRKENMRHCFENGLRKDIRHVAALKNGRIIAKGYFSRELAEKLIDMKLVPESTCSETIARSIRKKIDKGDFYYGLTFISINNL